MIILRNKEFSSKEQKARRRKFDFQVAKESGRINPKQYFDPEARRRGREELKLRGTKEETYLRNVDHTKSDPGNINAKLRDSWLLKNSDRSIDTRAGSIRSRGSNVSSKAADFIENRTKNYNLRRKKLIAKGVGAGLAVTGGVVAAGIGAKKLYDKKKKEFSDKEDKNIKDVKTAGRVAGAVGMASGGVGLYHSLKAQKIADKANSNKDRIIQKAGVKRAFNPLNPFAVGIEGTPENIKKAQELDKRYYQKVNKAIAKHEGIAKKAGHIGLILGGTSLGAGIYAAKKAADKKKDSEK